MPSSDHQQGCRKAAGACSQRGAHRHEVSGERPVLRVLQSVFLRGVQLVCDALKGPEVRDAAVGTSSESIEDSTTERMFHSCYESLEDISWGEERQRSDLELRTSTPLRSVFLPDSGLDVHINAKLRAVRQAFQIIALDSESRNFLKEAGLSILTGLLSLAGRKKEGFTLVWDNLMAFAENPSNWVTIYKECQEVGMQTPCFYDLFYETIVLRLLECSEQVPAVLKTTLRTPWISSNMKKTTVMFHAWALVRQDRELLLRPHGLYHHLCEVRDYIDPEMMWAAFGLQSDAKDFYFLLRGEVLSFVQHIFNLDTQSYASPAGLVLFVFSAWRGLACRLHDYLLEQESAERRHRAPQTITNITPTYPKISPT